jgi:hypothetical protein
MASSSSHWQKQNIHFQRNIWGISAGISLLPIIILLVLGFGIEVAGVFFLITFVILRIALAFIFKNRYANSMVRVLKFDYEELERDFRIVFKNSNIRFNRKLEEEAYHYEFPGHRLIMNVEPYWLHMDNQQAATLVTLRVLTTENEAFADMLAEAIDDMVEQRANVQEKA